MNFNKLQRTIILLLVRLLISHCGCDKGKSGNNRQSTRRRGDKQELTKEQKEELARLVKEEKVLESNMRNSFFPNKLPYCIIGSPV